MLKTFLPLFMSLTLVGWAQQTRQGEIVGRVNLTSGGSAGVVFLDVRDLDGRIVASGLTDVKGSFRLIGVPRTNPNLTLYIDHEGFEPVRQKLDIIHAQGALTIVYLVPEADPNVTGAGAPSAVDVRQLLVDIPDEARNEYESALEASEDGDHAEAIEHLERAVELAPDFYDAWIDMGVQLLELGRFEEAEDAYMRARESNPNGALAAINLGVLHYLAGELQTTLEDASAAAETFEKGRIALIEALQMEPFSVDARFYLGATLYKLGVYEEAEQMLQDTLDIEAGHPQARLTLLNVYARQTRYEAALEQAVAFLEENPDAPQRAAIERARSQIEAALAQ